MTVDVDVDVSEVDIRVSGILAVLLIRFPSITRRIRLQGYLRPFSIQMEKLSRKVVTPYGYHPLPP